MVNFIYFVIRLLCFMWNIFSFCCMGFIIVEIFLDKIDEIKSCEL